MVSVYENLGFKNIKIWCVGDNTLPVALHALLGRAFHPVLVYVQAGGQAHHWGFPQMKA